jgi:hypothetical protein
MENEQVTEKTELDPGAVETKVEEAQKAENAEGVTTQADQPQEEDVATLKKRLADTQAWGHQKAQEAAEIRRELEDRRRRELEAEVQPEVMGVVDKAIEARQIRERQEQEKRMQDVLGAVNRAIPEIVELQADPEFGKLVAKHVTEVRKTGDEPSTDPIAAIRAVNAARMEFLQDQARKAAEKAAQAAKTSKLSGMSVPGAGASSPKSEHGDWRQNPEAVRNMSAEDFAKLRAKALGF